MIALILHNPLWLFLFPCHPTHFCSVPNRIHHAYAKADEQNIVVLHSKHGQGRVSLVTIALLIFSGQEIHVRGECALCSSDRRQWGSPTQDGPPLFPDRVPVSLSPALTDRFPCITYNCLGSTRGSIPWRSESAMPIPWQVSTRALTSPWSSTTAAPRSALAEREDLRRGAADTVCHGGGCCSVQRFCPGLTTTAMLPCKWVPKRSWGTVKWLDV